MINEFYRPRPAVAAPLVCLLVCLLVAGGCRPPAVRVTQTRRLMGVPWTITLHAADAAAARAAIDAGFAEVGRLERILSDYDPDSELSRLSAASPTTAPVEVGEDLWRVLSRAVEIRDASDGSFDPTVGPLTTLWRQARRSGRMPRADKLAAARAATGRDALALAPTGRGVRLPLPHSRLDLGGIGMGYAVDRALDVITGHGIAAAMIDASGDVAVSGPPPGSQGWRIAVRPLGITASGTTGPEALGLVLHHAAVTTSGDAFQAVEIEGVRYSHIVDPRTGMGVVGPAAVTVVASDCTTADAVATAASVLGPQAGPDLVSRFPGCSARFVWIEGGLVKEAITPGWSGR